MLQSDGTILRYKTVQRVGHWLNASAFLLLLLTGLFLFLWPLAPLASVPSRMIHRVAAVLLMLGPLFYFLADRKGLIHLLKASFTYSRGDLVWFVKAPFYFFGLAKGLPPQGEINAGQRVHHALTIICYNLIAWSGLVMWFGAGRIPGEAFMGSLLVHDVSMSILTVLLVGHVYFTFVYGALDGMIKGTITRLYAQVEHPRWLRELEEKAAAQR
jgi:formate dehydrogenase subunit gamma